jgi:hypothetical protein
MRCNANSIIITLLLFGSAEIVLACSACIKDILSPEGFDRRSWINSKHVFTGRVISVTQVRESNGHTELQYKLDVIETFKGDPDSVAKISSYWDGLSTESEMRPITCGELTIERGDHLLVFSNSDGEVYLGTCSASRVIRGLNAISREERRDTIGRLRKWQ